MTLPIEDEGLRQGLTQDGDAYCSIGYVIDLDHKVFRKPALKLEAAGGHTDILV